MTTYYEIKAVNIDGDTEVLYGSFVKAEARYELDAEKASWKDEGYKLIKIVSRTTDDAPDMSVYTQEELNTNQPEREPVGHDIGVTVLHANNTRDSFFFGHDDIYSIDAAKKAWLAGDYDYVATINETDLDDVYAQTQNIDQSWLKVANIGYLAADFDKGARSTSVGDILLLSNEDGKTEAWIVAGCGFTFGWIVTSATIMESTGAATARRDLEAA